MKLDRLAERGGARPQIPPFGNGLLHAVLAEAGLAGDRDRRPDLVGRKGLGDGDELDRLRRPSAIARSSRNLIPAAREAARRPPSRSAFSASDKAYSVAGANSPATSQTIRRNHADSAGRLTTPTYAV